MQPERQIDIDGLWGGKGKEKGDCLLIFVSGSIIAFITFIFLTQFFSLDIIFLTLFHFSNVYKGSGTAIKIIMGGDTNTFEINWTNTIK